MLAFLKSLFGLTDAQARSVFVWAGVAMATLVALIVLNAGLWLVSTLWNISAASPFGVWGFTAAILIALAVAGIVWWRLTRRQDVEPPTSQLGKKIVERYTLELATSLPPVSDEERTR